MRILVVISTWGTKNDRYLLRLIEEYRSMSFQVDIVVLSNISREIAPGVEVVAVRPRSQWSSALLSGVLRHPWLLPEEYREWKRHLEFPFAHKQILADRANDYDLFIYSEDDTLITEKNIQAFLRVSAALREDEIPGFVRFERGPDGGLNYPEVHGIFHWDPRTVRTRSEYTLAFFTCEHAGCYVLSREQLRRAIDAGGFLVEPHSSKYDLLCTAATDPYTQCGFQKLVCISHLDDFLIHHLPNKYVGTSFGVDDREFRRQVDALLRIGGNGHSRGVLFETETRLPRGIYSKNYYEPVRPEIMSLIPPNARSVLSLGCEWGATEAALAEKGLRVVAVPLDPVIPGGAQANGVEIVDADLTMALTGLREQRFDCLLLLNVLHLAPDPVGLLSSLARLLSPGAAVIILSPNVHRLPNVWRKISGEEHFKDLGDYEKTGVHPTSPDAVGDWLRRAGMKLESTTNVLSQQMQRMRPITFGLADSFLASEFIVTASPRSPNS